jgi:hypothetical protein
VLFHDRAGQGFDAENPFEARVLERAKTFYRDVLGLEVGLRSAPPSGARRASI